MHQDTDKQFRQLQSELEARKECEQKIMENINANQEKISDLIERIGKTNKLPSENKLNDDERDLQRQDNTSVDLADVVRQGIVYSWQIDQFPQIWSDFKIRESKSLNKLFSEHNFTVNATFTKTEITIYLSSVKCNCIFFHARIFTLVDQSGSADNRSLSVIDTPVFNTCTNYNMISQQSFRSAVLAPINLLEKHFNAFVKNSSLLIEICFIPLTIMYKSVASRNGTLLWRIDNYSKKKQDEIEGTRRCLISDSFYTSNQGYRVQVKLFLNGFHIAKGKSISIYVDFIKGEFDNSLPDPFNATAMFILREQSDSRSMQHFCREITFSHKQNDPPHGEADFVQQSQAEEAMYLKEDALLFKIMMEIKQA